MIDYAAETAKLEAFKPGDSSQFWKPEPGQFRVKALGELEEAPPFIEEGKPDQPQVSLEIEVLDAKKSWTIPVGKTMASVYGQLCRLAKEKGGMLTNVEFTLVVVNDGTKNSYTIVM